MENIKKGTYEGYLWWSNAPKPEILIDKKIDGLCLDQNKIPFIIEGQLYDKNTKKSYSIRYADGRHYIVETDVTVDDINNNDTKHFVSHRMEGIGRLLFIQYWDIKDDNDRLCEGMKTQVPGKLVFCGFERKEDEE